MIGFLCFLAGPPGWIVYAMLRSRERKRAAPVATEPERSDSRTAALIVAIILGIFSALVIGGNLPPVGEPVYVDGIPVPSPRPLPANDLTNAIHVSGKIENNTMEWVRAEYKRGGRKAEWIELDSWGGDGDGGIKLAWLIYERWPASTKKVFVRSECNSACSYAAFVALGKGQLYVGPYAKIGVHQVYDNDTGKADVPWTKMAARILRRYGAPAEPLRAMIATPPSDLTYFGYQDLIDLGAKPLETRTVWNMHWPT